MRQMRRASRGSRPVILLALEVVLVVAFVVGLEVVVVVVVELEVVVVVVAAFEPFKSDFHVSFQRWKKRADSASVLFFLLGCANFLAV